MNKAYLLVALVVCTLVGAAVSGTQFEFPAAACTTGALTGAYVTCIAALANSVWKIHQWGEDTPITICGNSCVGNIKGRISKWEWKWDGKFRCDNKAQGITGEASGYSQDGTMKGAIEDWIKKSADAGKIKASDFKC